MVFGAMTQGNGFESGYNLRNLKWTGDFYSNAQAITLIRFTGVDVNLTGSNIYFVNTAAASTINVLHVLTLSEPYKLSSATARISPTLSSSLSLSSLSFTTDGYIYTAVLGAVYRSTNAYGTNFALPIGTGVPFTNTGLNNGTPYYVTTTGPVSSNVLYNDIDTTQPNPGTASRNYTCDLPGVAGETLILTPSQARFGLGMAGSCYNPDTRRLFTLENANVVQNTMFLTTTYFSPGPPVTPRMNPKYQRVNLYPLFPRTMKPRSGHGICVDRDKGQYLFVCCTIGANEYIVKFQMRSI